MKGRIDARNTVVSSMEYMMISFPDEGKKNEARTDSNGILYERLKEVESSRKTPGSTGDGSFHGDLL